MAALFPLHELAGAGTHRIEDEVGLVSLHQGLGHDGRKGDRQVAQRGAVGIVGLDRDSTVTIIAHILNKVNDMRHGRRVDGPLRGELDIRSSDLAAAYETAHGDTNLNREK